MLDTIGQKLKQLREKNGISLEEISQHTRIRLSILLAIEDDDLSEIPSEAQARGFLKLYADYLKVDLYALLPSTSAEPQQQLEVQDEILNAQGQDLVESPSLTQPEPSEAPIQSSFEDESDQDNDNEKVFTEQPQTPSLQLFRDIGHELRQRRDLLSLPLENIADYIHIKEDYLRALEAGKIDSLPSNVQARGMLQNYAHFLNMNTDAILLRFAEGLQQRRLENAQPGSVRRIPTRKASPTVISLKKFFTLDLFFGSLLILGILAFLIWGTSNMLKTTRNNETTAVLPDVAEVLVATPMSFSDVVETFDPNQTQTQVSDEELEPTPIFTPISATARIQIVIVAKQDSWIRVISDYQQVFEGRLEPGNAYTYVGEDQVEIMSGNAAGLQIFFNQNDIGSVGVTGQVVNLIFNENGLIRPTATTTPTPTFTPEGTQTMTPTNSRTPTPGEP